MPRPSHRKGTKQNPFTIGDVVFVKRLNRTGIVSEARIAEYPSVAAPWARSFAPIRYMVRLVDTSGEEIECTARDLEEVKERKEK